MAPRTRANVIRLLVALAGALLGFVLAFRWADSPSHPSLREARGESHRSVVIGSATLGGIVGAGVALVLLGGAVGTGRPKPR